jgi:DNA-binding MarR family transcriptional regulator
MPWYVYRRRTALQGLDIAGSRCVRIACIICAMRTDSWQRPDIADGGPALFRLVRFWSRRWAAGGARESDDESARVGHILVLEAIDASHAKGSAAIGDVAVELGLDRSNASRMLAAAVAAGLVTKTVSPADGRRTELRATASGRELLASARSWQRETFTELVADWPAEDARKFAGYLRRLAAQPLDQPNRGERR